MKYIPIFILILTTIQSHGQSGKKEPNIITTYNNDAAYRLFPTENMWTFIKLNTRNGQMWQVQYSVGEGSRFATILSAEQLVPKEKEVNNRFTLYATQNMYNFILLDQIDGRTWQAQWSMDAKNRGIIPID